jgi:N-acetylmuramoyl-L-alanine amidase
VVDCRKSSLARRLCALIASLCLATGAISPITGPVEAQIFDADVGLDPGHSYVDVGAVGGGIREFELNLETAQQLRGRLLDAGYSVRLTREDHNPLTPMNHPDPTERIRIEQTARYRSVGRVRAYVSINYNGISAPSIRGTEAYFNPESVQADASYKLAEAIQRNMVAAIWEAGYPALDRGTKSDLTAGKPYGHFFNLRGPNPSVVVEGLFLTNPGDVSALSLPEVRAAVVDGYVRGILEFFALSAATEPATRSFQQTPMASTTIIPDILD